MPSLASQAMTRGSMTPKGAKHSNGTMQAYQPTMATAGVSSWRIQFELSVSGTARTSSFVPKRKARAVTGAEMLGFTPAHGPVSVALPPAVAFSFACVSPAQAHSSATAVAAAAAAAQCSRLEVIIRAQLAAEAHRCATKAQAIKDDAVC